MLNFLKEIINNKIIEIEYRKKKLPLKKLKAIYYRYIIKNRCEKFISKEVIGEVKFFTPIIGKISFVNDIKKIIEIYSFLNINVISVLTEKLFFAGKNSFLSIIKSKYKDLYILRKDFIIDIYQIYESIIIGSDIILLIVYLFKVNILKKIIGIDFCYLLEVFSFNDIKKINFLNFKKNYLIGINSRNLKDSSFKSKEQILNMSLYIKNKNIFIESGIKKIKEVVFFKKMNFGMLIGEFFIKIANECIFRN